MRKGQPCRAGVVEIGEGALFQIGFMAGLGNWALGEPGGLLFGSDDPVGPLRRAELVVAHPE